jgi:predicted Zn-dependent protease
MGKLGEAYAQLEKDCDPTYAQRTAACSAKFKTLLDSVAAVSADEFKAKVEEHKKTCAITDADREAARVKFADFESQRKQKAAEVLSMVQDSLKAKEAFEAGRYDEAFKVERADASATEAFEIKASGKPGDLTASALIELSWYALFARQYATALDAAERSTKLKPDDLVPETNRAHALMLLGRITEAKTIYLAHKGEPLNGKTWEQIIADDFARLRKAGITHPFMDEVEAALKPRVATPPTRCPEGKPLCV